MAKLHDATRKRHGDTFGTMLCAAMLVGFFVFVLPMLAGALGG